MREICSIVAWALGVACLSAPSAAQAQEAPPAGVEPGQIEDAERYAEEAFDAYEAREYEKAIALYERARSAAPSADILYNIARVYDLGLNDREHAVDYYRQYIAHARAQRPRSELARQRIAQLEATSAPATPAPAAASSTLTPAPAAPPTPPAAVVAREAAQPASPWTARELSAAAFAGVGVASLGVGVGFGVSAYAQRDAWRKDCDGNLCTSQRSVNAAHSATRRADLASVALIAGAGLLSVGATLWWIHPAPEQGSARAALQLRLVGGSSAVSGVLSGGF